MEGGNLGEDAGCKETCSLEGLEVEGVGFIEGFVPVLGIGGGEFSKPIADPMGNCSEAGCGVGTTSVKVFQLLVGF